MGGTDWNLSNRGTGDARPGWLASAVLALLLAACGEAESPVGETGEQDRPEGPAKQEVDAVSATAGRGELDDASQDGWHTEVFNETASGRLKELGKLLLAEGPPGDALDGLLADQVDYQDLTRPVAPPASRPGGMVYEKRSGQSGSAPGITGARQVFTALRGMLATPARPENRIYFKVIGVEVDEAAGAATTQVLVGSLSARESGGLAEHHLEWDVNWTDLDDSGAPRIRSIAVTSHERVERDRENAFVFSDCTRAALEGNACFEPQILRGMGDWHQRVPVRFDSDQWGLLGLGLGDVNGDGLEDLYVGESRAVPNRLFLQQPDGTLVDVSREWEVDWLENCHSSLLVDLDNDGDQDLAAAVVGSVVLASNEGNRFQVRAALPMPQQTTHLAAADYDRDGLLDLYAGAYHKDVPLRSEKTATSIGRDYLDTNDGAANTLFRNRIGADGWHFEDVTVSTGLDANNGRLTLGAAWEDFDNDGDLDLYVANDFGRNNLYRHDVGEDGASRFVDVADIAGSDDNAFGMSISWGDYNRDGWMDAYVANMWSSAGKRIVSQEQFRPGMSEEERDYYLHFARGNTLLQNNGQGARFADVSEAAGVTMGRWAWSSPFVDINNDGWEDLVVANGYITGPDSRDL